MTAVYFTFSPSFTLFNNSSLSAVQLGLFPQTYSRFNAFTRMPCTTSNRPSVSYDFSLIGNQTGRYGWPGSIVESRTGSNIAADRWVQNLLTMKSTRKSNGTIAAGPQVGASCPPATEPSVHAATNINRQQHYSDLRPVQMPGTEEDLFRDFLLSRLPDVKAPQSLRQKIKGLIKNSRP